MKTVFVLLVILNGGYSGAVLTAKEFMSEQACLSAAEEIRQHATGVTGYQVRLATCIKDEQS